MKINWVPGHMKKTLEKMKSDIKKVDGVIYVIDSRAPFSCFNPMIDDMTKDKLVIYVLSKTDLSNPKITASFVNYLSGKNKTVLSLNLNSTNAKNEIINTLMKELESKRLRNEKKEISSIFKFMVIGVPNTGKSTLINNLAYSKKATTGDKAGVTKSTQWVRVSNELALLDTPGTLWPNLNDELISLKLAFVGSIKDDVLDTTELGFELIKFLMKNNLDDLKNRFPSVDFNCEPIEVYDQIGKARGYLIRGGEVDYDRLGKAMIVDFRTGRMGRISLDKVNNNEK